MEEKNPKCQKWTPLEKRHFKKKRKGKYKGKSLMFSSHNLMQAYSFL